MLTLKRVFQILIICSLSFAFQTRQDPMATDILNGVSKKYRKFAGFSAEFTHDSETNSGKVLNSQKGKIKVAGSKYQLITERATLICDGKTVWTIQPKIKEVTVSDYEPEPGDITPERIYTFYQKGYKYLFIGEVKVKNKVWQTIDLEPENLKKEISKIRLYVDKTSHAITKWIVFERGTNERESFEVEKFEGRAKVDPTDFSFNKKKYPGYKVVDLR